MPSNGKSESSPRTREIRIAASVIERADGHIALVRKRGTTAFMQPGGKIEPGEEPVDALIREIEEELGLHIEPDALSPLGRFTAIAANETDAMVTAEVFHCRCDDVPGIQAEIEELAWIAPENPGTLELAPLTRDHILPVFLSRRTPNRGKLI